MFQTNPPLDPKKVLPTMYALKSEDPLEPGLPDKYHLLQARFLEDTFCPPNYPSDRIWLRWYDANGNWVLTPEQREKQRAEQESQRLERERRRVERLAEQLRLLGVEPDWDDEV